MPTRHELRDIALLRRRLRSIARGELPGPDAQRLMAPRPRHGWIPGIIPDDLRPAAALLLVYERDGYPWVLLTQRRAHLAAHGGQVSLPGGSLDPGESPVAAALREANEEVGLDVSRVGVVGQLTPLHIPASGFLLSTVVGTIGPLGSLRVSDAEVERVIEVPIEMLATPALLRIEDRTLHGDRTQVPCFEIDGLAVWGATAMILAEFLALLGHPPDPWATGYDVA